MNTIILKKGTEMLTKREFSRFEKGSTIFGEMAEPEELQRWSADQEAEAKKALDVLRCEYRTLREVVDIVEYALEYCECDDDGEFLQGSDYDLAEEV